MIFRVRFEQKGGHVHCRLFQAAAPGQTWQKNGDLVFDELGWFAFATLMHGRIEFVPEDVTTEDHDPLALFESMSTSDLEQLQTAHRLDLATNEARGNVDGISFGRNRLLLIEAVLRRRAES